MTNYNREFNNFPMLLQKLDFCFFLSKWTIKIIKLKSNIFKEELTAIDIFNLSFITSSAF